MKSENIKFHALLQRAGSGEVAIATGTISLNGFKLCYRREGFHRYKDIDIMALENITCGEIKLSALIKEKSGTFLIVLQLGDWRYKGKYVKFHWQKEFQGGSDGGRL